MPGCSRRRIVSAARSAARDVLIVSNTTVAPLYLAAAARTASARGASSRSSCRTARRTRRSPTLARVLDVLVANRFAPRLRGARARRRRGRRPGRLRRRLLPARRRLRAGADDAAGAGGLGGGRQDRRQSSGRQEPDRRLPPAAAACSRDTDVLATLPARELRAGLAEVIKYGLICDAALFGWLEEHLEALLARDPAALAHVDPPLLRDQGGDRRPRRARAGRARAAEPRPHLRPRDRGGDRLYGSGCTARRSARAC